MAQAKPQYQEPEYSAPYRGWNSQAPENLILPSDSPFLENFIIRNSELRTAPRFEAVIPHIGEDFPVRSLTTFRDMNNVTHTIAISNNNVWQLLYNSTDNKWNWNLVGAFKSDGNFGPFAKLKFLNKVYWTSNNSLGIFYWDGISNTISEATDGKLGGAFIGELGFNVILLNTIEKDGTGAISKFPQRIRWSPSGLPNVWDPVANPAAGYNDQLDVSDNITGFITIGRIGFVFRENGISHITLTGNAAAPFRFDHLWASDKGIGNVIPQSISSYGGTGIFISDEELYKITISSFEPIGLGARDKIMEDIDNSDGSIIGGIVPGYHRKFIYLTYHLFIPQGNNTILWIYHIEDKTWVRRVLTDAIPTSILDSVAVR